MALAGGVTVMATPAIFVEFSRQRGLAPDGRCKSFAEGRTAPAGPRVRACWCWSGCRTPGGWSSGAGGGAGQRGESGRCVERSDGAERSVAAAGDPQALANAGLSPADVDVVEAHGTGTRLGDPIEAQALLATYGQGRRRQPLWLGSVKSNIGHTQAAAGAAGIDQDGDGAAARRLPATLHVEQPSSHVDWASGAVELLTEARRGRPAAGRAGRGVVVRHQRHQRPRHHGRGPGRGAGCRRRCRRWTCRWCRCWSRGRAGGVAGAGGAAAQGGVRGAASRRQRGSGTAESGLAAASGVARPVLAHRAVVLAGDAEALAVGLDGGRVRRRWLAGSAGAGRVAFLFSGQGSQRVGMGRESVRGVPGVRGCVR